MTSVDKYLIDQLFSGTFADPFSYLGPHENSNGTALRVLLPGAEAVRVLDHDNPKKVLADMSLLDERGFFIARLEADVRRYLLQVRYGDQNTVTIEDPYRFGTTLHD